MLALILAIGILLLLVALMILIYFMRSIKYRTPWIILSLALIALIGLDLVYLNQSISKDAISKPSLTVILVSVSIAIFIFRGVYLITKELTPLGNIVEQHQVIFKNYPGFLILKDNQLHYKAVNSAYAKFLGKDIDSILTKSDLDFYPRSLAFQLQQEDRQALKSGHPLTSEHEIGGLEETKWLEITRIPYFDQDTSSVNLLVAARDITSSKKSEITSTRIRKASTTLLDTSLSLIGQLDLPATLESVLAWSVELFKIPNVFVCLLESDETLLRYKATTESIKGLLNEPIKPGEDLAGVVWQSGQPLIVENYSTWDGKTDQFEGLQFGTVGGFPIIKGSKIIGILGFLSQEQGRLFDEDQNEVLSQFCKISALAISNAQSYSISQSQLSGTQLDLIKLQHRARLERLVARESINFINLPPEDIDQSIDHSLQLICQDTGVNRGYLFILSPVNESSSVTHEWNSDESIANQNKKIILSDETFNWILQRFKLGEIIAVTQASPMPDEANMLLEYLEENSIKSFTAVPLMSGRAVVGFLGLESFDQSVQWQDETLELLKTMADMFSRALLAKKFSIAMMDARAEDHVRLVYMERRNRESTLITEMTDMIQACRTPDEAFPVISRYIQQLAPDLSGALYLMTNNVQPAEKLISWGEDINPVQEAELTIDECWALRRSRLHIVTDPNSGPHCKHLPDPVPHNYLCVPLIAQGEAIGLLHLRSTVEPGLTAEQMEFYKRPALMVADHVALALSNLSLRDELRSQAIRDPLTGLFNRRYMEETLVRELRRGSRHGFPIGIIMFDIDQMKPINDTLGHDAGDIVLKATGRLLQKLFRGEDVACRYGGDEFTIILPEASLLDVGRRANELREEIRNLRLEYNGEPLRPITLSIGVSAFPDHGTNIDDLIKASDSAIYAAKAEGGDRIMYGRKDEKA